MDFFMSSESDSRFDNFEEILREIRGDISRQLKDFLKDKNYGNGLSDISIMPIIIKIDENMEKEGLFKNRILYKQKSKEADIRLRINYDKFINGDKQVKRLLIIENIINSIREISKKVKEEFNAKKMEEDILNLFKLSIDDLDQPLAR